MPLSNNLKYRKTAYAVEMVSVPSPATSLPSGLPWLENRDARDAQRQYMQSNTYHVVAYVYQESTGPQLRSPLETVYNLTEAQAQQAKAHLYRKYIQPIEEEDARLNLMLSITCNTMPAIKAGFRKILHCVRCQQLSWFFLVGSVNTWECMECGYRRKIDEDLQGLNSYRDHRIECTDDGEWTIISPPGMRPFAGPCRHVDAARVSIDHALSGKRVYTPRQERIRALAVTEDYYCVSIQGRTDLVDPYDVAMTPYEAFYHVMNKERVASATEVTVVTSEGQRWIYTNVYSSPTPRGGYLYYYEHFDVREKEEEGGRQDHGQ